jgi:hypothetical protein
MTRIIEADEQGTVHLDREILGSKPGMQYTLAIAGDQVVLRPISEKERHEKPLWETQTPQQRAADFLEMVRKFEKMPGGPSLSDEALRRENMYD